MKSYLSVCLIVSMITGYSCSTLFSTSPEAFPFIALVESRVKKCVGVLITTEHVIAPASCLQRSHTALVRLGYNGFPHFEQNLLDPKGQTIKSKRIYFHDDFYKIEHQFYLNNIALIELHKPVLISENVRPGKLISIADTKQLQGQIVDVTGWKIGLNSNLLTAKVQLRNADTCNYFFNKNVLESQEGCINWQPFMDRLELLGNAVSIDGKIIGFQTETPPCSIKAADCSQNDKILYVSSFLDWITHQINGTTMTTTQVAENVQCCKQIDGLVNDVKEMKNKQQTYEALLEEALSKFTKLAENEGLETKWKSLLNEELNTMRSEIRSTEAKQDNKILSLEEEVGTARSEISNGLSAQKANSDILAKRLNDTRNEMMIKDTKINSDFNNLSSMVESNQKNMLEIMTDIKSDTKIWQKNFKSDIHHDSSKLKNDISSLKMKMNNLHEEQAKWFNSSLFESNTKIEDLYVVASNLKTEFYQLKTICNNNQTLSDIEYLRNSTNAQVKTIKVDYTKLSSNLTKELHAINDKIEKLKHDSETHLDHKLDLVMQNYTNIWNMDINEKFELFYGMERDMFENQAQLDQLNKTLQNCCGIPPFA